MRKKQRWVHGRLISADNPLEGEQARGWQDFHGGVLREENPYAGISNRGHAQRWDAGWFKAKMAKEQGKRAM